MDLCLTSQVLSALDVQRRQAGPKKLQIVFFRNRTRRRPVSNDVRPVVMAPSAALLQSLLGGGLGLATAGLTKYGIVNGGFRSLFPRSRVVNSTGLISTMLPIGVYIGSAMAFKRGFALTDPLELALATGLACRLAQWTPSIALASAVQVGLYETMQQQRSEALADDELGFCIQSSAVAGIASGLTYLAAERIRYPVIGSPFPKPILTPFILISAFNAIREKY